MMLQQNTAKLLLSSFVEGRSEVGRMGPGCGAPGFYIGAEELVNFVFSEVD